MRLTKYKFKTKNEEKIIENIANDSKEVLDKTILEDFTKDLYSLFEEPDVDFTSSVTVFNKVRDLYINYGVKDFRSTIDFYNWLKKFLLKFKTTRLYQKLKHEADPLTAISFLLDLFNPLKQQSPPKSMRVEMEVGSSSKEGEDDKDSEGEEDKGSKSKNKDQHGASADEDSLPIDTDDYDDKIEKIEQLIASDAFEDGMNGDEARKAIANGAGIDHKKINFKNLKELVKSIGSQVFDHNLEILRVARKHQIVHTYLRDEELKDVPMPDDEISYRPIKNMHEIDKVIPSHMGLDDELFNLKLAKGELLVRQNQTKRMKKQVLYLLVDVSGSMEGRKNTYASGVALSLVRQAVDQGCKYFLRFFDYGAHQLHVATDREGANKLCQTLIYTPFSGGGTSIQNALFQAIEDIEYDPVKYDKAEIMLITDGLDSTSLTKEMLKGIKLHTVILDNDRNENLRAISETFCMLKNKDMEDMR